MKDFSVFIPKLWICLKEGYTFNTFKKDLFAGLTVGLVALPLAMAFAIASGVAPERGLYTAIIAGFLISLLGGSRVQIGGPTGAFVVIVYSIVQTQGYAGLVAATLLASILLLLAGLFRLGTYIKFVPHPLVTGFTTGIAVIIFSSQIKELFGLPLTSVPAEFIAKWGTYFKNLHLLNLSATLFSLGSILLILAIRRFIPRVPWGISAIVLGTLVSYFCKLPLSTVQSTFGNIPKMLPAPELTFSFDNIEALFSNAVIIAFLAGIESLLSAVVADGMIGTRHKSNCELVAQGVANFFSVIFGGIPATGAIARTATNVKTGGKTPVAGMIHAVTLLLILLFLSPLVSQIPLASLAAVLVIVAWDMSEMKHFIHLFKGPLGDVGVLLSAFLLTVLVDLTVAIEVGIILAAFLFMKRMSDIHPGSKRLLYDESETKDFETIAKTPIPPHVEVFEIEGPFFFAVADTLKDILHQLEKAPFVFILRLRRVPVIDASGLNALKEFYTKCKKENTTLFLSGVQKDPYKSIQEYGLEELIGKEHIFPDVEKALQKAALLVEKRLQG